jgi:hypothetical protein
MKVKEELDLNKYTDRQIVTAFMGLRAPKFLQVINAIGAISVKMQKRGELIAKQNSEMEVDELLIQILKEGEAR